MKRIQLAAYATRLLACLFTAGIAPAEQAELRISKQYGLG